MYVSSIGRRDGAGAGDGGGSGHPPTLGDPGQRPVRSRPRGRGPAPGLVRLLLVAGGLLGAAGELAVGLAAARRPDAGGCRGRWCGRCGWAAALETYVGSVTGTGSHRSGSAATAAKVSVSASSRATAGRSAVSSTISSTASTTCSTTDGCQARSRRTISRQATSHATRRAAGAATQTQVDDRGGGQGDDGDVGEQQGEQDAAATTGGAVGGRPGGRAAPRGGRHDRGLALDRRPRPAAGRPGRHDQSGVAAVDRLAPGQHAHRVRRTGRPTGCAPRPRGA